MTLDEIKAAIGVKPYYEEPAGVIYCADCMDILPKIPEKSIDLVLTDPPYGINFIPQRGTFNAIANDKFADWEFSYWLRKWAEACSQTLKDGGVSFWFSGWSTSHLVYPALSQYWNVKSCIVWKKNNWGIGYHTRPQHEFVYLCHNGDVPKPENQYSDVWEFSKENGFHSCQKPVRLIGRCVGMYSSDLILDPFLGSGTTAVAAKQLGRKFIGIEISEKYCEIAKQRLAQEVLL